MLELSNNTLPCVSAAIKPALEIMRKNVCVQQKTIVKPMLPVLISYAFPPRGGNIWKPSIPFLVDNVENNVMLPKTENSGLAGNSRSLTKKWFQDDTHVGQVDCNNRGCRPVYDEDASLDAPENDWLTHQNAATVLESRIIAYHNRESKKDQQESHKPNFFQDFAEFLSEVWMEKATAEKYYEAARNEDRHNAKLLVQYAQFAWTTLANISKAESLFQEAISESPEDPAILASYAHFLWQCDA